MKFETRQGGLGQTEELKRENLFIKTMHDAGATFNFMNAEAIERFSRSPNAFRMADKDGHHWDIRVGSGARGGHGDFGIEFRGSAPIDLRNAKNTYFIRNIYIPFEYYVRSTGSATEGVVLGEFSNMVGHIGHIVEQFKELADGFPYPVMTVHTILTLDKSMKLLYDLLQKCTGMDNESIPVEDMINVIFDVIDTLGYGIITYYMFNEGLSSTVISTVWPLLDLSLLIRMWCLTKAEEIVDDRFQERDNITGVITAVRGGVAGLDIFWQSRIWKAIAGIVTLVNCARSARKNYLDGCRGVRDDYARCCGTPKTKRIGRRNRRPGLPPATHLAVTSENAIYEV